MSSLVNSSAAQAGAFLGEYIISDQDFSRISSTNDLKQQRTNISKVVERIFRESNEIGGALILEKSFHFLEDKRKRGNENDQRIATVFREVIQGYVLHHEQTILRGRKGVREALEEGKFLKEPEPQEKTGVNRYAAVFWDPKGSPRPRQIIAEWGHIAMAISAITVGALSLTQSASTEESTPLQNCTGDSSKTTAYGMVGGGIAYLAANVAATVTIQFYGPAVYDK